MTQPVSCVSLTNQPRALVEEPACSVTQPVPCPASGRSAGLRWPRCAQLAVYELVWLVSEPLGLHWPAASASPLAPSDAPSPPSAGWLLAQGSESMERAKISISAGFISCFLFVQQSISKHLRNNDNSESDCSRLGCLSDKCTQT